MRIALGIEYDGSRFLGWQTQPGGGAVQDAVEPALAAIAGEAVSVTCAGRTDRGVHAREQVVHFDTVANRPSSARQTIGAAIAQVLGEHGALPVAEIAGQIKAAGRDIGKRSVSHSLQAMKKQGLVKSGNGRWMLSRARPVPA